MAPFFSGYGHSNGNNGGANGVNGQSAGIQYRDQDSTTTTSTTSFEPVAICGMACRLPGGVHSPAELWDFLLRGGDGRCRVPQNRYNISGHYSSAKRPATIDVQYGYFLDDSVDLAGIDTSFTAMGRSELDVLDPQQRLLLEVTREALHDAGATGWAGSRIGVYIGSFGEDYHNILHCEELESSVYHLSGSQDYMVSARISHELDLQGPNMTIRTACSSSMVALNEACAAIAKGDCDGAIVAGSNLILTPALFLELSGQGVLSHDGHCRSLSADANGYARGEGVVAIYIKSLRSARRDGNPIRSVIVGCAANSDGRTIPSSMPSAEAQAALIRRAYHVAGIGIQDLGKTALFECHATGTATGDPIECAAIADVFGHVGVHVGTVKPNMGHSEATSGLTAILKATLALEHRVIPPNIKYAPPNPRIPFERAQLHVPTEPEPWPQNRHDRVSVNSFGIGGSNVHAILESAARFVPSPPPPSPQEPWEQDDEPQLLLFSANTSVALNHLCTKYQALFDAPLTRPIASIAYTLANGREHLPFRSFAVASTTKFHQDALPSTSSKKVTGPGPNLVFVFTGQGAAWPQMGRDLVRSNPTFSRTIDSLDISIKHLGADWTLRDELLKSASASRVYQTEFSQPLCTALQVALVDTLASMGVKPQAVIGHSSGEIGAAYAAGALTAEEAIKVAFLRGIATKGQTVSGGMAAIGLGSDEVQEYLIPGVVTACDNSPSSVTLSGDADKLADVVTRIKQTRPGVPITMLKVDKAFHSQHMLEFGEAYNKAMVKAGVVGRATRIPFFSSVTGRLLGDDKGNQLGPKYWQTNLEQPVMFKNAVQAMLKSTTMTNPVFLELGPHPALAGPVRQILTAASTNAPCIASLVRRQNSTENLLQAIGKLYTLNVSLDYKSIVTRPASFVAGLPTYPWDHSQKLLLHGSRLSREWLYRRHVHHPLLGIKVPASTDVEPTWRNLLSQKYVPWITDHKISGSMIFPLAGFVSIAAEAGRQVSGIDDGASIRDLVVHNALVLNNDLPTEIVTTLRRERLTDNATSTWWEFTISSYNDYVWIQHTTGYVRGETFDSQQPFTEQLETLPRKVEREAFYKSVRRAGLEYGPTFQTLEDCTTATGSMTGIAKMRNNQWGDETYYHMHPIVFDTYYQLQSCSVAIGIPRNYRRRVATKIELITMFRSSEDELDIFNKTRLSDGGHIGDGWVSAGSKKVLSISGSHSRMFEETFESDGSTNPISALSEWGPHVDFQSHSALIKEPLSHGECLPLLDTLVQLAISLASKTAEPLHVQIPHLAKYKEWLLQSTPSDLRRLDVGMLSRIIEAIMNEFANSPAAPIASTIVTISKSIESVLRGEITPDLDSIMAFLRALDDSAYIRSITHTKPNARVLLLGAGLGERASSLANGLMRPDGQPMYANLVVADPSPVNLNTIKERFECLPNTRFSVLDVTREADEQGFQGEQFDFIIASNVISMGSNISAGLKNLRYLLHPRGRLLLQEARPGLSWVKFALATLPGWWSYSEDSTHTAEPFNSAEKWEMALVAAGFADVNQVKSDSKQWANSIFVARPQPPKSPVKRLTVLVNDARVSEPNLILNELESRGYTIDRRSLGETLPHGQDILALLEEERPFFEKIDALRFEKIQSLFRNLGSDGLLWVTRLSSIGCTDPRYAQVVGLARSIRSEMAVDFAVLETDSIVSPVGAHAVANVVRKFQTREDDGVLGPDLEYAIHNNQTLVNRIVPFSLGEALTTWQESNEAVVTQKHLGRLNTLTWSTTSSALVKDDEVEVEVYALGLNFRDVLIGMQIIPEPQPSFGYECTGIVRRVGPKVTKLAVGDRVIANALASFSTVIRAPEINYEKLPEHISFIEGASIPLAFLTAVYGLRNVCQLSKGQSVLIHSGAGGVGLAAIQVAQMLGAEIYVTVGSEVKVQYLMDAYGIPRNHIFNSRDASFVDDVLHKTGGKGVDVLLNSLAGELLHASWKCVAKWGTMVEIGKRDLLGNARLEMGPFLANRNYRCIDAVLIEQERPELVNQLLKFTLECFTKGYFKPIRLDKVFPASQLVEAFRYMQQGKHIGKIVLEVRDPSGRPLIGEVDAAKRINAAFDETASYLLVGGLGGLGRSISIWMAGLGARNFTFLSRSAGSGVHDADLVNELKSMGCTVQLVSGDVSNPEDVVRAVNGTVSPLRGVIQMSMVLRDQMFDQMNLENWNAATHPKVEGTWNLHNATIARGCELDFFLLFSSLSGIVGQVGQANYASANTFLDAFVQYRTNQNLACTAIDLGAMEGIGYLSNNQELLMKMKGTGWSVVHEEDLFSALPLAFMPPAMRGQRKRRPMADNVFLLGLAPTVPLGSPESSSRLKRDVRLAFYHNIGKNSTKIISSSENNFLATLLENAKKDPSFLKSQKTVDQLAQEVGKKLCSLVLADDTDFDISANMSELGLDSLVAVEIRAWWKLTFGFEIGTMDLLSLGTLGAAGKRIADELMTKYDS